MRYDTSVSHRLLEKAGVEHMASVQRNSGNVFYKARKEAAKQDSTLYCRADAAQELGISEYTLRDYETGKTKEMPAAIVVAMASRYNAPQLTYEFCKYDCPIGCKRPLATELKGLEGIALRLIREMEPERIARIQSDLADIAEDGKITADERPILEGILHELDNFSEVISELRICAQKTLGEKR